MRLLLPQNCLLCGADAGDAVLCTPCLADLPLHDSPACPICAQPTATHSVLPYPAAPEHNPGEVCGACLRHPPAFTRSVSAYTYRFPLDKLIPALKYHHQFAVVDVLTAPLVARVASASLPDALIAMPLHPLRLRERGFNQSLLLARRLAARLQIPLLEPTCQRIRDTAPQTGLPVKQRQANLRNAFVCTDAVANKRIAIVDDVMTTGSSLDSLARALLRAGAADVQCWVSARAVVP